MLIKRTDRQARRGTLAGSLGQPIARRTRPPHLPAPLRPRGRRPCRDRCAAACDRPQGGRSGIDGDVRRHHPQKHLHALLGWLHAARRSGQRRVGRPGAGLGFADHPRLALRQGRRDPRAGARRPPPALPDEAGERAMDQGVLGCRDQRDRRQADGNPRQVRRGLRSIGSAPPSSPTKAPISTASSPRSGAPTTPTTRRASATPPPSPA